LKDLDVHTVHCV